MEKKKGFTLVEVLAVVVILSLLIVLAVPLVTGYIGNSRKKLFIDDALTVADAVKHDIVRGGVEIDSDSNNCVGDFCYYDLEKVNKLLDSKLKESSFGNDYATGEAAVCVVINQMNSEVIMTMIDSQGYGFVDLVANTNDSRDSMDSEKVSITGDIKASDARVAIKGCVPTLKTAYRWSVENVSVGDKLTNYEINPKRLDEYNLGFYLKHVLNNDDVVLENYVCYVIDDSEHCIRGGGSDYYSNNLSIINSSPGAQQCTASSTSDCESQFSKFSVTASPYGYVRADGNDGSMCVIQGYAKASSVCNPPGLE